MGHHVRRRLRIVRGDAGKVLIVRGLPHPFIRLIDPYPLFSIKSLHGILDHNVIIFIIIIIINYYFTSNNNQTNNKQITKPILMSLAKRKGLADPKCQLYMVSF